MATTTGRLRVPPIDGDVTLIRTNPDPWPRDPSSLDKVIMENSGNVASRERFKRGINFSSLRLKRSATTACVDKGVTQQATTLTNGKSAQRTPMINAPAGQRVTVNNYKYSNNLSTLLSRTRSFNNGKSSVVIDGCRGHTGQWPGTQREPPTPPVRLSSVVLQASSTPPSSRMQDKRVLVIPKVHNHYQDQRNSSSPRTPEPIPERSVLSPLQMVSSLSSLSGGSSSLSRSSSECPSPVTPSMACSGSKNQLQQSRTQLFKTTQSSPTSATSSHYHLSAPGTGVPELACPLRVVSLPRDPKRGFGLSLVSSMSSTYRHPAVIGGLDNASPAARCGRLFVGDALVTINGVPLADRASLGDVKRALKDAGERVTLSVRHFKSPTETEVTAAADGTLFWSGYPSSGLVCRKIPPELATGSFLTATSSASPAQSMGCLVAGQHHSKSGLSSSGHSFISDIRRFLAR